MIFPTKLSSDPKSAIPRWLQVAVRTPEATTPIGAGHAIGAWRVFRGEGTAELRGR